MIVVFGSLNIDMVMPVDRFPKPGETVLCSTDYLSRTGGKGANQAVAAVRAGAKVAMVGKVGDDAFGRRSLSNLKTQSILTVGVGISERPTGCSTIAVDNSGANIVITAPGANLDATSDQMPDEIFLGKNIILTQMETAPAETFSVLARAHAKGTTTVLNASPAHTLPIEALKTLSYLIVNELEAMQLAQGLGIKDKDPRLLGLQIAALGDNGKTPFTCIITMEERGCVAIRGREVYLQEALNIEVVDTTGGGDAFCGIFAACLQAGKPWLTALHFASVGASLSCLGLGAQAGMPFMDDIEEALHRIPPPKKMAY
jgi:ribokinase